MITIKHSIFVSEPIGIKKVEDVPGIGNVYGGRLRQAGYTTASDLLEQYLKMNKNADIFDDWLRRITFTTRASHTSRALEEYW